VRPRLEPFVVVAAAAAAAAAIAVLVALCLFSLCSGVDVSDAHAMLTLSASTSM
jgi:hypothetical protein